MSEPRSLFASRSALQATSPRSPGTGRSVALGGGQALASGPKRSLRPLRLADWRGRGGAPTGHLRPGTPMPVRAESQAGYFDGATTPTSAPASPTWMGLPSPLPAGGGPGAGAWFDNVKLQPIGGATSARPPLDRVPTLTLGPPARSPYGSFVTEPEAGFAATPSAAPQAQLLARRGQLPNRLGTNLQRKSLVPLAMLATILLSKVPLLYATEMTSRGLVNHNKGLTAGGEALIATSTLMMWTGVGVGIYDTFKIKPALQRDPRLRYLGPRSAIFALSALAACAPLILAGSLMSLNHAAAQKNFERVNWLRIPANVGASGQNFAAGFLYTVMQMRRGWTPLKVSIPLLFAAGTWVETTGSQFGLYCGKGNLPQAAQQASVLAPYVLGLFIWCEMFSRLTYVSLQNQLTDTTALPWESVRGP